MLHQAADDHLALVIAEGIDVDLSGVLQVLINQHRLVWVDLNCLTHVAVQLIGTENHLHGAPTQHVAGPDHHWITDAIGNGPGLIFTASNAIGGLTDLQLAQNSLELLPILGKVDRLGRRAPNLGAADLALVCFQPMQQR